MKQTVFQLRDLPLSSMDHPKEGFAAVAAWQKGRRHVETDEAARDTETLGAEEDAVCRRG